MNAQRIATRLALGALALAFPAGLSASALSHHSAAAAQSSLQVTNNNAQAVYVVLIDPRPDGWAQWPLGTIAAKTTRTFQLHGDVMGQPNVRIVASAFSNWKEYESRPVTFRRGRQVDLTLNNPEPYSLLASK